MAEPIKELLPYPKLLAIRLPKTLDGETKDWRFNLLMKLSSLGLASVTEHGGQLAWSPAGGNEDKIRANYDRLYNLIDYSLLMGYKDVEISKCQEVDARTLNVTIEERIEKSRLYDELIDAVPPELLDDLTAETSAARIVRSNGSVSILQENATTD